MILLIPREIAVVMHRHGHLHFTMILLILIANVLSTYTTVAFTFHYDSINSHPFQESAA